jgi:hypothetical protein
VQDYLPLITGGVGAIVVLAIVCYAFYIGKLHSDPEFAKLEAENATLRAANDRLQEALDLERQRSNDVAAAGTVTNQLIGGLISLAGTHRADDAREHQDAADRADARALQQGLAPLDLAGKDVGL